MNHLTALTGHYKQYYYLLLLLVVEHVIDIVVVKVDLIINVDEKILHYFDYNYFEVQIFVDLFFFK